MATLDLRYYNQDTGQWEAPLANGVDLDALEILVTQLDNRTSEVDNTSDTDKPISTATQQALTNISDTVNNLNTTVTTHLDEYAERNYVLSIQRDLSLTGEQRISLPKKAKKMRFLVNVMNAPYKDSEGFWTPTYQGCRFSSGNTNFGAGSYGTGTSVVVIANDNTNLSYATCSDVTDNGFTLNWTHENGGASGVAILFVEVSY